MALFARKTLQIREILVLFLIFTFISAFFYSTNATNESDLKSEELNRERGNFAESGEQVRSSLFSKLKDVGDETLKSLGVLKEGLAPIKNLAEGIRSQIKGLAKDANMDSLSLAKLEESADDATGSDSDSDPDFDSTMDSAMGYPVWASYDFLHPLFNTFFDSLELVKKYSLSTVCAAPGNSSVKPLFTRVVDAAKDVNNFLKNSENLLKVFQL